MAKKSTRTKQTRSHAKRAAEQREASRSHAAILRRDVQQGRYALLTLMAQAGTDAWLARPLFELARTFRQVEAVAQYLESEARS